MRKRQKIAKHSNESFNEWLRLASRMSLISGFVGIAASLLGLLLSLYVYVSPSDPSRSHFPPVTYSLLYFVGGITLLGIVIVAVGILLRWKNHDVIVLKRRVSEIYLLALRKSALNPNVTSNE